MYVYVKALSVEEFAVRLAKHFTSLYQQVQLVIQEDQMRAHGEQMRAQLKAQGEEMRTYAEMVRDLVQAIQMSGLQISLPAPHLVSPSTSEPPRPADTQ
ncbi:hypothetical protein DVH24_001436 [Malus domestica]|uniref:Uncharacterized protein n=1 Tax=Malus domestica TaxID=3750 RepID=A0A498K783_MALDO|nr:hypothetical protein DVH24_001436 [Malus domestica]